jgi:hypothetical protein
MPNIPFGAIKSTALERAEILLPQWLPGGKWEGADWVALNPTRDDGHPGSFKANRATGVWKDFANGDGGSDLINLYAYLHKLKNGEAAKHLAADFGIPIGPCTLADLAVDKRIPIDFLRELGLHDLTDGGVAIPYLGLDGSRYRTRLRLALKAKDGSSWMKDGKGQVPYGLDRLKDAREAGFLVLVEGESDCWTGWYYSVPMLGIPGATSTGCLRDEHLVGIPRLYAVQEPGEAGNTFITALAKRFPALRVVRLSVKDVNDLHRRDPDAFRAVFEAAMAAARPAERAVGGQSVQAIGQDTPEDDFDAHVPAPRPDPAMLYGLAGDVGRIAADTTEANRYAATMGYLTFLSAMCGRDIYLPIGNIPHHARIYELHVGRTAIARKGEALSLSERIAAAIRRMCEGTADSGLLGQIESGGLSSREGLVSLIQDPRPRKDDDDDEDDPGTWDKRLWLLESEFANVLHQGKRDGNTLSTALRDAWDGRTLAPIIKKARIKASLPHIAISGAITPSELISVIDRRELSNGFANRFIIFWAERERLVPSPAPTPDATLSDLADRTVEIIKFAKGQYPHRVNSRTASLRPSAEKLFDELYLTELSRPAESDLLTSLLERRAPYMKRLAMLFAITDQSLMIERRHIEAALAWVRYWSQSVRFIFSAMADIAGAEKRNEAAGRILTYVRKHHEVDRLALRRDVFQNHAEHMDDALTALLSGGRIELIESGRADGGPGRKRKVYRTVSEDRSAHSAHSAVSCGTRAKLSAQPCAHSAVSFDPDTGEVPASDLSAQSAQRCAHSESLAAQQTAQSAQSAQPCAEESKDLPDRVLCSECRYLTPAGGCAQGEKVMDGPRYCPLYKPRAVSVSPPPPAELPSVANVKLAPLGGYLYIGRKWSGKLHGQHVRLPESFWHNPYKIGEDGDRDEVIAKYEARIRRSPEHMARLPELSGKVLGCWCAPQPCHGDVLARLVAELSEKGEMPGPAPPPPGEPPAVEGEPDSDLDTAVHEGLSPDDVDRPSQVIEGPANEEGKP